MMSDKYTEALRELETLRANGKIDQAAYDVHRQKLLAEASAPRRFPLGRWTLEMVLVLAVLIFVIRLWSGAH